MTHGDGHFALVIGIDDYPNWAGGKRRLTGANRDATEFHRWLINPEGGGLDLKNARLVVSTPNPIAPLQDRIDKELAIIAKQSTDGRERFYFFFSGHGHSTAMTAGEQTLRLANWSLQIPNAGLNFNSYFNTIMGCLQFKEGLFFLDCCRSREAVPSGKPSELNCIDPNKGASQHITYYAAEPYNAAYEYDAHGVFGKALIDILNEGTIEALDLERRLKKTVTERALSAGRKQTSRTVRDAFDDIFLGPPPSSPSPPEPPSSGTTASPSPKDPTLKISLDTNLSGKASLEDVPPPASGSITLYRGEQFIDTAVGSFNRPVPKGAYTVHIAHGDAVERYDIEVKKATSLRYPLPERHSAVPLWSTVDKRETVTDPIVAASRYEPNVEQGTSQALFIAHRRRETPLDGEFEGELSLLPPHDYPKYLTGNRLLITTEPGTHFLHYDRPESSPLTLAVPVVAGWDTHLFFLEDEGQPLLERASISMRPAGTGFDPADALIDAYERAVADLASDGPGPDPITLDNLLYGKFKNPLFGLVGAHFLLRELARAKEKDPYRMAMLDTVIDNMGRLLGAKNADVLALELLRAKLTGEMRIVAQCNEPPLLRASLRALIDATANLPDLLGQQFDAIALGAAIGSPWCCWRTQARLDEESVGSGHLVDEDWVHSFRLRRGPRVAAIETILANDDFSIEAHEADGMRIVEARGGYERRNQDSTAIERMAEAPEWLIEDLRDEIARSERRGKPVSLAQAVRRLNLPYRLIEQALRVARTPVAQSTAANQAVTEG